MSRDSNGNYSLPASYNPVVSGTVIDPDWANTTLDDMSVSLTDSLSRSGKGGMLAPFYLFDGTISAPGMSFISENTSGIYRNATNDFRWAMTGRDVLKLTKVGLSIFGDNTTFSTQDSGAKVSRSGNAYFLVESTSAPANEKMAAVYKGPDGTVIFGNIKDDLSLVTKGIQLKPGVDNAVYDVATGKPFLTDYAGGGTYLPLVGGTLTGDLTIQTSGYPSIVNRHSAAPGGQQLSYWQTQPDGTVMFAKYSGSAWQGGIKILPDGNLLDVRTGGTIWNSNNDGAGTGLDADLLDGYGTSVGSTGWSVPVRDQNGTGFFHNVFANIFADYVGGAAHLRTAEGNNIKFHWAGPGNFHISINDGGYATVMQQSFGGDYGICWGGGDPGFCRVGPLIFEWGHVYVNPDTCNTTNLARHSGGHLASIATFHRDETPSGDKIQCAHIAWANQDQIRICLDERNWYTGGDCYYFYVGWWAG